eukprot:scaffold1445_cov100-Isochrysis_galbana.AAC.5
MGLRRYAVCGIMFCRDLAGREELLHRGLDDRLATLIHVVRRRHICRDLRGTRGEQGVSWVIFPRRWADGGGIVRI